MLLLLLLKLLLELLLLLLLLLPLLHLFNYVLVRGVKRPPRIL